MAEPVDYAFVRKLANRLLGSADDVEQVCQDEMDVDFTPSIGCTLDTIVWRCVDCDHWTLLGELKDDLCFSCRPGEQTEVEQEDAYV